MIHRLTQSLTGKQYCELREIAQKEKNEVAVVTLGEKEGRRLKTAEIVVDDRFMKSNSERSLDLNKEEIVKFLRGCKHNVATLYHTHPTIDDAGLSRQDACLFVAAENDIDAQIEQVLLEGVISASDVVSYEKCDYKALIDLLHDETSGSEKRRFINPYCSTGIFWDSEDSWYGFHKVAWKENPASPFLRSGGLIQAYLEVDGELLENIPYPRYRKHMFMAQQKMIAELEKRRRYNRELENKLSAEGKGSS